MITFILWTIIILSVLGVAFMGIKTLLLIIGIVALTLGILSLFSSRFDNMMERKVRPQFETKLDKIILPRKTGHFISRYLGGSGLIVGGLIMIFAYFFIFN